MLYCASISGFDTVDKIDTHCYPFFPSPWEPGILWGGVALRCSPAEVSGLLSGAGYGLPGVYLATVPGDPHAADVLSQCPVDIAGPDVETVAIAAMLDSAALGGGDPVNKIDAHCFTFLALYPGRRVIVMGVRTSAGPLQDPADTDTAVGLIPALVAVLVYDPLAVVSYDGPFCGPFRPVTVRYSSGRIQRVLPSSASHIAIYSSYELQ